MPLPYCAFMVLFRGMSLHEIPYEKGMIFHTVLGNITKNSRRDCAYYPKENSILWLSCENIFSLSTIVVAVSIHCSLL